jgi:ATP synthase protein I
MLLYGEEKEKVNDFKFMFKKIALYDFFISLIFAVLIFFTLRAYVWIFLLGLIIALLNFYLNGIIVEYSLDSKNEKKSGMIVVGFFIRISLVGIVGFIIGRHDMYNIIAYMFGYTSQFISLLYYGINNKNFEGK